MLLSAKRPVIQAGQGVLYAEAWDELRELAELTQTPVMTTMAGKSAFPENHRLSLGTGANSGTLMCDHFLKKTDFVLGVGTSFTISNFNAPMPGGVTLAQITNCPEDLNKDYRIDLGAIGDAKIVLQQVIEEVKRQLGEHGRGDISRYLQHNRTRPAMLQLAEGHAHQFRNSLHHVDVNAEFRDSLVVGDRLEVGVDALTCCRLAAGNKQYGNGVCEGLRHAAECVFGAGPCLHGEDADLIAIVDAAKPVRHVDACTLLPTHDGTW